MFGPDQDQDTKDRNRYIDQEDATPQSWTGDTLTSGSIQSFGCPECGSRNTAEGAFFEECRTCGWSQGY